MSPEHLLSIVDDDGSVNLICVRRKANKVAAVFIRIRADNVVMPWKHRPW
jgi:hypothetical protein